MIAATVEANRSVVRQQIALLGTLAAAAYNQRAAEVFSSSIGGHVRHIIEHYRAFLDGLTGGEIDYEKRARDPRIEQDPTQALAALHRIEGELAALKTSPRAIAVTAEYGGDEDSAPPRAASSPLRELEFLLSHTVHHHALIAVICRLHGHATPEDFGVAPSTLRHLRQEKNSAAPACAR